MFKQGKTRASAMVLCLVAATAATTAWAADSSHGLRLADAMAFDQAFGDNKMICRDQMKQYTVDAALETNPGILGGIKRGDPEFGEAEALYIEMMAASCDYDDTAVKQAFVRGLEENLSQADADALVAFYATDLGQRFLKASLATNIVSSRAVKPKRSTDEIAEDFGAKIRALVAHRPTPATAERVIGTTQALPSDDAAVALSDRVMKHVAAGTVVEGFDLAMPHALVTKAQMDEFTQQVLKHQATWDARFGKSTGYELLRNDTVGDSMMRSIYLHRFDEHAIVWYFIWYRGTKGWVLTRFVFVEDSAKLFQ